MKTKTCLLVAAVIVVTGFYSTDAQASSARGPSVNFGDIGENARAIQDQNTLDDIEEQREARSESESNEQSSAGGMTQSDEETNTSASESGNVSIGDDDGGSNKAWGFFSRIFRGIGNSFQSGYRSTMQFFGFGQRTTNKSSSQQAEPALPQIDERGFLSIEVSGQQVAAYTDVAQFRAVEYCENYYTSRPDADVECEFNNRIIYSSPVDSVTESDATVTTSEAAPVATSDTPSSATNETVVESDVSTGVEVGGTAEPEEVMPAAGSVPSASVGEDQGGVIIRVDGSSFSRRIGDDFSLSTAEQYCEEYAALNPTVDFSCSFDNESSSVSISTTFIGSYGPSHDGSDEPDTNESTVTSETSDNTDSTDTLSSDAATNESTQETTSSSGSTNTSQSSGASSGGSSGSEPEEIEYRSPRWGSDSLEYPGLVSSVRGDEFCKAQGHSGLAGGVSVMNRAGQFVYGCWENNGTDPETCAPCWKEPWVNEGCNVINELSCTP